jgi:hypothetical protein
MNENKIDYSKLTISQADLAKYTFSKPPSNIIFYDTSTGNQREVMRITKDGVTSNPDVSVDEGAKAIIRALDGYIKNLVKESLAKQEQRSDSEQLSTECVSVSVGEPVAWYIRDKDSATTDGCWAEKNLDICEPLYTTPQQRKPLWIDPNDKTQAQFLPHIGEPVLFCHKGKTYYGKHTGGSFKTGQGITAIDFITWSCHWMYLPAAHGIKE